MFDWGDLRVLLELARSRSLSGAAKRLGVRHTTVARRLEALELTVNTPLFDRTPSGYLPNAAGAKLLSVAEAVESGCLSAMETVANQTVRPSGTVRLCLPEGLGTFLAARSQSFYEAYPDVDLEIVAGTQFLNISKRETDVAVTLSRPRVGRIVARKLVEYRLRLFGSNRYLEKHQPIRRITDLKSHDLVGYIDDLIYASQFRYIDEIIPAARVRLRCSSINAQVAAIEAGLGLGILPSYLAAQHETLVPVLATQVDSPRTFWLTVHQDMRHVRRIEVVWEWIVLQMEQYRKEAIGSLSEPKQSSEANV